MWVSMPVSVVCVCIPPGPAYPVEVRRRVVGQVEVYHEGDPVCVRVVCVGGFACVRVGVCVRERVCKLDRETSTPREVRSVETRTRTCAELRELGGMRLCGGWDGKEG